MRSVFQLVVLFAGVSFSLITQASSQIQRLDGSRLTTKQAESIAEQELKSKNVMGAQIAVLNHGRTVWTYAYGLRDAGKQLPMKPDTNTWAASLTKSVFATWVMHLVEQGRLDLDKPIVQLLPKPLNQFDEYKESASEIVRDPGWAQVTPRMLLAHTSGLSNITALSEPDKKMHLHFTPGERYAYSGAGLNLLQLVLEETVVHVPLDVAMQKDLFVPLGMAQTGMVWHDSFATNMALRYGADGKYLATTHRQPARAGGNMASSVQDLSVFVEALFANKLLRPATRAQMFTPQMAIHSAHQFPTLDTTPGDEGVKVGLAYGLGWGLLTKTRYGPAFFKEGHGDGAQNYIICFSKSGTCMIMLTNSDNGELAFRPLLEEIIGDTVTPWEWESYTRDAILSGPEHTAPK